MSADLATQLREAGDPHACLAEAVVAGQFGMLASDAPEDWLSPAALRRLPAPYLVVLASNDPPTATRSAKPVRGWANAALVHASTEMDGDYRDVITLVARHRKVLLVETLPNLCNAWVQFLHRSIANVWAMR